MNLQQLKDEVLAGRVTAQDAAAGLRGFDRTQFLKAVRGAVLRQIAGCGVNQHERKEKGLVLDNIMELL